MQVLLGTSNVGGLLGIVAVGMGQRAGVILLLTVLAPGSVWHTASLVPRADRVGELRLGRILVQPGTRAHYFSFPITVTTCRVKNYTFLHLHCYNMLHFLLLLLRKLASIHV